MRLSKEQYAQLLLAGFTERQINTNMDGNAFDLCDNVGLKLYAKKEEVS